MLEVTIIGFIVSETKKGNVGTTIFYELEHDEYRQDTAIKCICKRQVLFHIFWQLIFHKKRQLIFHTYLVFDTHGVIRGLFVN